MQHPTIRKSSMDITVKATLSTSDTSKAVLLNVVLESLIRANSPLAGSWHFEKTGTYRIEKTSLIEIEGIPGNTQVIQHLQHALKHLFHSEITVQFKVMGSVVYTPDAITATMNLLEQRLLLITERRQTFMETQEEKTPVAQLYAVDH